MQHNHPAHEGPVFVKVVKAKKKVASALLKTSRTLELTFDQRQEVPHDCLATDGSPVVCHVHDPVEVGDRLISEDNQWVLIAAAPEELFEIARNQANFDEFLHVAGLCMWPVQLTAQAARVVASQDCLHMLAHFKLDHAALTAPMQEISVPELPQNACCDHPDHDHGHGHDHSHHNHA